MGWMLDLYQTYENNIKQVGQIQKKRNGNEYTLLPIGHTAQKAQIEVTVGIEGDFHSARVVEKHNASTVIPCTEDSFSRTSKPVPHPLHDKLMYVAGDFEKYGGKVKNNTPYKDYLSQLHDWCESPFSHYKVKAVYDYLRKGTLVKDLVSYSILHVDHNDHLIPKWTKKVAEVYGDKPDLFKVLNDSQDKVFIRFDTHEEEGIHKKIWEDDEVYQSFINYYKNKLKENDVCYVTGEVKPKTERHSNNLRRSGDNAKLISANDNTGFTYRGRFAKANHAANISYDISQKAHNALKWLIMKQGKAIDERVFLVWGNDVTNVPSPQDDALTLMNDLGIELTSKALNTGDTTHEVFAEEFNKALSGYESDLSYKSKVNLLVLDSATPGRLAVLYYRSLDIEGYLNRIKNWHQTCSWLHRFKKDDNKNIIEFYGAPATKDIGYATYGHRADEKVVKGLMERMLPCIIDGQKLPLDILKSLYHRASSPVSMERWEWEKTLSIACALFKKHYHKEGYEVALDENSKERDYLFGRLLAIADVLESRALPQDEKRATNAVRYMNAFSKHPARTWSIIQANIQPYQARLGGKATFYNRLIDEVASNLKIRDFNNKPLSGLYLLGFYSQRNELYKGKQEKKENID